MTRILRADAQDNRDRVLAAAQEAFTEHGLDVSTREIARRAGVGPATLYRRFPTKQTLIDEAFGREMQSCRQIVEEGCADPDPWRGFSVVVERLILLNVGNRGFVDAFLAANGPTATIAQHRRNLLGTLAQLAERAKANGDLRADFTIDDLVLILLACRGLASTAPEGRIAAARRFSALSLDAFGASTA